MYLQINKNASVTLTKQIYTGLVNKILKGELSSHERLPSTREFSKELGVSRIILLEVYEQLVSEGFCYSLPGSGTYISEDVTYDREGANRFVSERPREERLYSSPNRTISFRPGIPDLHQVPIRTWAKIYHEIVRDADSGKLDYQNSMGSYQLREELTKYLQRMRGVHARPEQIMVVTGAAQAFSLLRYLVRQGEFVLVEDPCSNGLKRTLEVSEIPYQAIGVDDQGLMTEQLPPLAPKLIITTPSHQFPTGVILPVKRRIELIQYAKKHHCYIVEDDYDSEYRFEGSPIPSLQSLEPSRTIYVGTFSKTFSPAIRMGYMVLPEELIPVLERAKYGTDIHSPIFEQLTMARFIREGLMERHIRNMSKIYGKRRMWINKVLRELFGERVLISGDQSGLHMIFSIATHVERSIIEERLKQVPVEIWDINRFYMVEDQNQLSFIIGYGNSNEEEIQKGLELIYTVFQ